MMERSERSISQVVQESVGHVQELFRSEVRLAKAEVREEAVKGAKAATLLVAGALFALYALALLLWGVAFGLGRFLSLWAAFVSVGVVVAVIAAILISVGRRRMRAVTTKPERTIETVKENIRWAKNRIESNDTLKPSDPGWAPTSTNSRGG